MKIWHLFLLLLVARFTRRADAVRGCTVIAIQPDLRWKKAVCDSDSAQLTSIPQDLPETLISLRVTQQNIRHLSEGVLNQLIYLEELYIDSCGLLGVDANAFKGLNRLRILSLRNNSLQLDDNAFPPETFRYLTALEVLDISENPLGEIPLDIFPRSLAKTLIELRLSHTKGDRPIGLDTQIFLPLVNLQVLDLSFTKLTSLQSEFRLILNSMPKLRELQLGGNPWHCDCSLRWMREWFLSDILPSMQLSYDHQAYLGTANTITPICQSPYAAQGRFIFIPPGRGAIEPDEFVCKHWIDTRQRSVIAVAGGNLSLACHGYTEVPQAVEWFKDGTPIWLPTARFSISTAASFEFTVHLNSSHVSAEDAGTWECRLKDAGVAKKASINVTVVNIAGSGAVSRMDASERQNLAYAGIGVAIVFILLAAIALSVFCCGGCVGPDKQSAIKSCKARFLKSTAHGVDASDQGDDARELIGTRVANCRPHSPVPVKLCNISLNDEIPLKEDHSKSTQLPSTDVTYAPFPLINSNGLLSQPACNSDNFALDIPSPQLVSLSTTTSTTTALTQPLLATMYKPQPPHKTVFIATGLSTPSNSSINANYADLYGLPLSGGYGAVTLPSHLLTEIAGSARAVGIPAVNTNFLVSSGCPLHGNYGSPPPPPPRHNLEKTTASQSARAALPAGCPIHGSPNSTASQSGLKKTASSFTQTPRRGRMSKSTLSLNRSREFDSASYHSSSLNRRRLESSSSSQARYRTLPSRINQRTITSCPIHGHVTSSLLRRRSCSVHIDRKGTPIVRSPRKSAITVDVPYCSSCASSSSDSVTGTGGGFEDYSSDTTESHRGDSSNSGSSDYAEHPRPLARSPVALSPCSLVGETMLKHSLNGTLPGGHHKLKGNTDNHAAMRNSFVSNSIPRNSRFPGAIMGQPVVLSVGNGGESIRANSLVTRNSSNYGKFTQKLNSVIHNPNYQRPHHSTQKEHISYSSLTSFNTPKSILIKTASTNRQSRRQTEPPEGPSTSRLL